MSLRRVALVLPILLTGCQRGSPADSGAPVPPDAVAVVTVAAPADGGSDAGVPSLPEGTHAYQGKLGAETRITMELVRSGEAVRGSYVYTAIGQPLLLAGKVEPTGVLVLGETVNGKATGTLRLRPEANDLVGEWSDPAGKRTFPLRLVPVRVDAGRRGPTLVEQARLCLDDLDCPASEVARLFLAADDAHEEFSECYRFLDGAGVARDVARGRACLERASISVCGGSSALLPQAELAMMRIDGVGGSVDIAGARGLFKTCFADVTKDAVLEHAAAKERDPKGPAIDACTAGGTTIVWEECAARGQENERTRGLLAAKTVAASLDPAGRVLFAAANKAYADYVHARVLLVFEIFNGGSVRVALATGEQKRLEKQRAEDLAAFTSFKAKVASEADVARAAKTTAAASASVPRAATTPGDRAVAKTEATWRTYRDAEVALYDHAFGGDQGHDRVRRALTVLLSDRRVADRAAPSDLP